MSSTSNACELFDGSLKLTIYDPEPNIQEDHSGNYTKGKMDNESSPKSFYVVYNKINYGRDDGDGTRFSLIPPDPNSGTSEEVNFGFTAKSAHGFDVRSPAIVLFEYHHFIGNGNDYRTSHQDITPSFSNGAASVIITGGKWRLWGSKNYRPPIIAVGGEEVLSEGAYPTTGGTGVQSIERVSSE